MRFWIVSTLGLLLVGGIALAQVPVGAQFQVNSYTTDDQWVSAVAMDSMGRFVVVWVGEGSFGTDTHGHSVQAQRYDSSGAPVGTQFQVNTYTTSWQRDAVVATDALGNFVVVWESYGSYGTDNSKWSIQAQRYYDGTPVGGQFQVNSYTTSYQYDPAVASDSRGNFVVVWNSLGSYGTDTVGCSIQAQLYDATGAPVGGQFQVNSYTTGIQTAPTVAADAEGNFVVVWQSNASDGTDTWGTSIQAQFHDASGTAVGPQLQVNSYTTSYQYDPAVASDSRGDFVVVWDSWGSYGTDTDGRSVQAQRYDSSGAPVGGQFQVNSYTTSYQYDPAVASDSRGDFVVVWDSSGSYGTDTDGRSVQAQRYDSSGAPVGGQFQVNSYTTSWQTGAKVSADAGDNFVVVWMSDGSNGSDRLGYSIQGQRYWMPIFTDGFESGDTSAWSSTVQ